MIARPSGPCMRSMLLMVLSASLSSLFRCEAAPILATDARLAIVGDSITEQKLYSKFMETYLLACAGRRGMINRMKRSMLPWFQ